MRVFFFFKQKTAYEMRISDWSSDVCSSDLYPALLGSFLFGALSAPFPDRYQLWAAGLMILYFAAQYGEGAIVAYQVDPDRSEERRVGKAGVSTWRSRWSPNH